MLGMSRLTNDNRKIVLLSLLIIVVKFISYAKLQSLLYVFFAMMLYSKRRISINKGTLIGLIIVVLFAFTRIIRNPEQDLSFSFDFLFRFIGGFYFGSPVVNFSYVIKIIYTIYTIFLIGSFRRRSFRHPQLILNSQMSHHLSVLWAAHMSR
ncbi:Uncharacterised protein [Citrobacter werkmanii]|uniref:Uncharacterized protein n=1 Tax=Citrobacter werkmanii TaxID=67827 RepID=A0ABM8MW57_9ENTR|nr:Uncharacterised protein [Citrobacter werkmanii]